MNQENKHSKEPQHEQFEASVTQFASDNGRLLEATKMASYFKRQRLLDLHSSVMSITAELIQHRVIAKTD